MYEPLPRIANVEQAIAFCQEHDLQVHFHPDGVEVFSRTYPSITRKTLIEAVTCILLLNEENAITHFS